MGVAAARHPGWHHTVANVRAYKYHFIFDRRQAAWLRLGLRIGYSGMPREAKMKLRHRISARSSNAAHIRWQTDTQADTDVRSATRIIMHCQQPEPDHAEFLYMSNTFPEDAQTLTPKFAEARRCRSGRAMTCNEVQLLATVRIRATLVL